MSPKPCCKDMKAYRVDFWPRILPANPVTDWIQVCEDHGLSIQVDLSQDDGLIEVRAKMTFMYMKRVDTCMFAATAALCQHTTPTLLIGSKMTDLSTASSYGQELNIPFSF